jgi:precorrin-4/cobalt-precorrin-4 C11-methyltransferase
MKVFFIGAGPGDPELLTLKADRILRSCRCCIYAGSLVNPEVLKRLPEDAERYDSARMDLPEIIAVMEQGRSRGIDVVRLHSGDPSIYGAIRELMNELDRLGIAYEVVPGVSSFQAAAAALPAELTAPEISQTIILTRASGRTPVPPEQELSELGRSRATLCIFLSVDQLERISNTLIPHYGADCPAAVIYRASWPDQRIIRGTLADLVEQVRDAGIKKTAQILVGRALSRDIPASKLYDREFSHGYRRGRSE